MLSQVTMKLSNGKEDREVWFFLETDHSSISDLHKELAQGGTICGVRIDSAPVSPGRRREIGRYQFILGREKVVTISEPQTELLPPLPAEGAA